MSVLLVVCLQLYESDVMGSYKTRGCCDIFEDFEW